MKTVIYLNSYLFLKQEKNTGSTLAQKLVAQLQIYLHVKEKGNRETEKTSIYMYLFIIGQHDISHCNICVVGV